MGEYTYKVVDERGSVVADKMSFDNALILLKGLFNEYYNETDLSYSIVRYDDCSKEVTE